MSIIGDRKRDRNFRYARQEGLSGKTVREFPVGDRLQPEEIPIIHWKTSEKWGGNACFGIIGGNCLLRLFLSPGTVPENDLAILGHNEKAP